MIKNRGIAFKLIFFILISITIIFATIFGYDYLFSRRIIIKNAEVNAGNLAMATVGRIDIQLKSIEKVSENIACFMENSSYNKKRLMNLLHLIIKNNHEVYGAAIAFEPYAFDPDALCFAPYFYKSNGEIKYRDVPYKYFYRDWYQIPKELNRPVWSEPYYGEAGGIIMTTYSVPFYRNNSGKRQFSGVVAVDVSLNRLQKVVSSIKILQTGYGFLISKNGTFITHPDNRMIMNESIFSVAEEKNDPGLRKTGRRMIRGETGFVRLNSLLTGKKCWMAYAPVSSNGWSLAIFFPEEELTADISSLNHMTIFLFIGGSLFLIAVIILIAGSITKPLRSLAGAAEDIGTGNLDVSFPPVKSLDEVGKLTEALIYMKDSLKQYIKDLTETTAAKEKIESELKIAHDIQMDIIPKVFPAFPNRTEFDIYATIEPAREVGGDLYDFFFMETDHLCFTVGDVSGKGVPASLFMAVTMTLIKAKASKGLTPDKILSDVNQELSINNTNLMFVTLFLGILDINTGEMEYCNGGHNPPCLIYDDGRIEPLETTGGMALGVMDGFAYQSKKVFLQEGDTLFLYTDGVTEAMNKSQELFSEERLLKGLTAMWDKPIEEIISGTMDNIRLFVRGESQSDDITMMALRFKG